MFYYRFPWLFICIILLSPTTIDKKQVRQSEQLVFKSCISQEQPSFTDFTSCISYFFTFHHQMQTVLSIISAWLFISANGFFKQTSLFVNDHENTKQLNTTKLLLWSHREKLKSSVILQYLEARLFPRKSRPWDPQSCIFRRPCQDLTHNPLASWIFINLLVIYSLQSMMVTHVHWRYCRLNEVHSKVKMGRVYLHHPDVNTQNSLIRLCILRSN